MTRQPSLWREFGITAVFLLVLGAVPGAMMVLLLHDQEKIGELVPATNPLNLGVVVSLGAVMGGLYLWSSAGPRENSRFRVQDLNLITGFILVASIILYMGSVLGYLASIFFRPQVRGVPAGDVVGWCIELTLTYVFCTFAMTLVNYVDESADNKAYRQELNEKEGREWRRGFVENVLSFPENYPQEFGSGVEAGEMVRVSARSRKDLMGEWRLSGRSVLSFLPVIFLLSVICVAAWGFPGSIGGGWVALMCGIHALAMWCTGYVIFINLIAMPFGLLRAARPATIALLGAMFHWTVAFVFTLVVLVMGKASTDEVLSAMTPGQRLPGLVEWLSVAACLAGYIHGALKGLVPVVRRPVANSFHFLPDGTVEIVPEESVVLRSPGKARGKFRWLADLLDPQVPSRLLLGSVRLGQRYICAVLPDRPVDDSADRT